MMNFQNWCPPHGCYFIANESVILRKTNVQSIKDRTRKTVNPGRISSVERNNSERFITCLDFTDDESIS